ncbi:MAG: transposase [Leptospiraceae bacterium]|nr:transposase [Leptospiraceae bacterium]
MAHLKIDRGYFGALIYEQFIRFPMPVTASELVRRWHISYPTALKLKRRVQLLCCQQMDKVRTIVYRELDKEYKGYRLPKGNLSEELKDRRVVHADTVSLYSMSQRTNKYRARYRSTGQTASIYMSPKVGGHQRGILANVISCWKGGPVIIDSVPDQRMDTLYPVFNNVIAPDAPIFTDEGFKWLPYANARQVNHNKKSTSAGKRYKWARDRWVTKEGVHNNQSESINNILKTYMRNYRYVSVPWSQVYLQEFSFFKALRSGIKIHDLVGVKPTKSGNPRVGVTKVNKKYTQLNPPAEIHFSQYHYLSPTLDERKRIEESPTRFRFNEMLCHHFPPQKWSSLHVAMNKYDEYYTEHPHGIRKRREERNTYLAGQLWSELPDEGYADLGQLCEELNIPKRIMLNIARVWAIHGLVKIADRTNYSCRNKYLIYDIEKRVSWLPRLLYTHRESEVKQFEKNWKKAIKHDYQYMKKTRRKY